jgi:hypothetical protein
MNRLSGTQLALRSEKLILSHTQDESLSPREVVVAFGMPYESLLGVICHSIFNAKEAGRFFAKLAGIDQPSVADYLSCFVARLRSELDFDTPHLEVKKEFRNTPMDFPRRSPSLFVCLPVFWFQLMDIPEVAALAGALPDVKPPPRKPETIPKEWLRVQLLPSTLLPMNELAPRFLAWRAARKTQLEERDGDGIPVMRFDPASGRVSTTGPFTSEPLEQLLMDLAEFVGHQDVALFSSWRDGDELWRYSSDASSWAGLAGRAGFVWLRDGETHRVMCTTMS